MIALCFLGLASAASFDPVARSAAFDTFLDATLASEGTPTCFTPLVGEMKARWSELSPSERAEVGAFLGPAATLDSVALGAVDPAAFETAAAAPPPTKTGTGEREICIEVGDYGANTLVGDHFTIAWDDGVSLDEAEALMEAFDHAYAEEVGELGWREPVGMDLFNLWVYIAHDNAQAGAYTTAANCPSRGYMAYIVVYSGTFQASNDWYEDCVAHELNHASQQAYGLYQTYDEWWWEATATWMEEYVFSHNGWSQHTVGFGAFPYVGMHASSQAQADIFWHMYGMSVLAFYLDEYVGGMDLVRGTWEYLLTHTPGVATMPEVLDDMDVDFDATYAGFLAATTVMEFRDQRWFYPVELTNEVTELPHEGAPNGELPEGLGQNYIEIDAETNPEGKDLKVTFTSEEDTAWYVVLVTTSDTSTVTDYVVAALDDSGAWVAQIPWTGEADAYLVVSPDNESLTREHTYDYLVELVEPPAPSDTGDTGVDGGDGADDTDDESTGGCACATTSTGGASWWMMAFGALVLARRRYFFTGSSTGSKLDS